MRNFFLYGLNSGLLPKAPGTWGSVVGGILGYLILLILPQSTLFLLSILVTLIAVREINIYEKETNIHDDKRIVIDEIVGMWLSLSLAGGSLVSLIFSFIYFRIFDIMKPSIIGKIDKKVKGGWGVMGDDIVAGVAAGIMTSGTIMILHKLGV
ncbi:MAG: phosphatidylglycerophosphatase A [Nautilia sp.]|nr:MAG: phosphatidylglycerophosphatase A [Nautilia sp.]